MSHFALLDENNIVVAVFAGSDTDEGAETELSARTGQVYKQTSFNTRGGVHYDPINDVPSTDQSKAFRKNYAGIGYAYDETRDAFIPPQPYPSWVLNEDTCLWDAPVARPDDGLLYTWDETSQSWQEVTDGHIS